MARTALGIRVLQIYGDCAPGFDHGGTMPFIRANAINWPICSLAWTMIRRYMPSTVASRPKTLTLRRRSSGFTPA